jgi:hypothetical protein
MTTNCGNQEILAQIEVCTPDVGTPFNHGRSRLFGRIRQGFGNNAVHSDFSNARQPSVDAEVEFR